MIIVMASRAQKDVDYVISKIEELGYKAHVILGVERTVIAAVGDEGELELGGEQVRISREIRGAELLNRFYDMWRYNYNWTWKGAYHSSPSVANLKSRPGLQDDLDWIRHHAAKLTKHKDESP